MPTPQYTPGPMTWETWVSMTEKEREAVRDYSNMTPQLKGLEGWRVEVQDVAGDKPRRFIVGRSTGWRPCHLEVKTRRSMSGNPAAQSYFSVRRVERVR